MPVLPGEHIVVVYVIPAEVVAVVLLLLKQDFEQPHRIVGQGKAAEAGCVFGFVLLHDLRDPGHGVPYGQRLHRKVDAVPFQAQYLAAAQAVQRGDIDDRVEALVFDGGQQVSHLRFRVERAGKLRCVRHDDQIGGICLDQTVSLRQFERLIEHVLVLTQELTADRPPWPSERPNLAFTLMYVCSASPSTSHSRICRSSK